MDTFYWMLWTSELLKRTRKSFLSRGSVPENISGFSLVNRCPLKEKLLTLPQEFRRPMSHDLLSVSDQNTVEVN